LVALVRSRQRVGDHVTADLLLDGWSTFVAELEGGYGWGPEEYANDLSARTILGEVIEEGSPELRAALEAWLAPLDERFDAVDHDPDTPSDSDDDDDEDELELVPERFTDVVWIAGPDEQAERAAEWARAAGFEVAGRAGGPGDEERHAVIAATESRIEVFVELQDADWSFQPIVHPEATVGEGVSYSQVGVIGPGAVIEDGALLWAQVFVAAGARVGREAIVENAVVIGEGAEIGARARVCAGSVIGAGARIEPEAFVAPRTVVAPGAVVTAG
jgi:carbonic anhydrase/acetyltransferase-like protein (isoleucine patch superfamily)